MRPGWKPYRTWLVHMLTGPNVAGDRMKPATACAYFRAVVPALIAQLGTEDPATLGKDDIEVWYGDLLEPLPPGRQRITMASGLREFHAHLVTHYQAEPISAGDILGPEAELQAVDARLVWPDEVSAARRWLEEQGRRGQHPARMRAISLLLMLIFRCGLRRMEAFKLRLCDVHPADGGDLRILPHPGRRLKSHSSKRNIPLRALLSTEEHDALMSWLQTRRNEENAANNFDGTQYLFSIPRLATRDKELPEGEGWRVRRAPGRTDGRKRRRLDACRAARRDRRRSPAPPPSAPFICLLDLLAPADSWLSRACGAFLELAGNLPLAAGESAACRSAHSGRQPRRAQRCLRDSPAPRAQRAGDQLRALHPHVGLDLVRTHATRDVVGAAPGPDRGIRR